MERKFSALVGIIFILIGGMVLAAELVAPQLGSIIWNGWRLWPTIVLIPGIILTLAPLLAPSKRGLGGLFIPGIPLLTTGGILLYASVFNRWGDWEWLWALEVIGLGLGFLCAALFMRTVWLLLPAILIGVNGAILLLCAVTGLWEMWAVLWALEPLALGLSFLLISGKKRSGGLFTLGVVLCVIAGMGLVGMTGLFATWQVLNILGPIVLLVAGMLLLARAVIRRPDSTTEDAV